MRFSFLLRKPSETLDSEPADASGIISGRRRRVYIYYIPSAHAGGRSCRSCPFSSCGLAFHRGPQYLTPPVSFPSLPPSLGLVRDMNIFFHNPATGINDLELNSRGSRDLTCGFSGEPAEDSLDVPSPTPLLISAGPKYN
jgi:hypothetical protein